MLGSNIGDRYHFIFEAKNLIKQNAGEIIEKSSLYETEPWGFQSYDKFFNQAVAIKTEQEPLQLLQTIQNIEHLLQRERGNLKYHPRTIDIDILFHGQMVVNSERLYIPHPLIQDRRFVLIPLVEINSQLLHPVYKKTVLQLLKECTDTKEVMKIDKIIGQKEF
jgi:2-amino-4-hydroxy-6-hydroxymethyldihydropteridine diphosphokinase